MKLTKKRSITLSIELWEWCAETGKYKEEWPGWEKYGGGDGYCFLCEYSKEQRKKMKAGSVCGYCPYYKKFNGCLWARPGLPLPPFGEWNNARTPKDRKKYAKLFLAQLKELLK